MPLDDPPVGYKSPPIHPRWPPGTSGNPSGRKRGSKNWKTMFAEAMAAKITVNDEGRRRRVSKESSMFMQLANQAAQGDAKARNDVRRIREYIERTKPPEQPAAEGKRGFRIPVVILPHNGRDKLHPDLEARYLKAFEEFCEANPEAQGCGAPFPGEQRQAGLGPAMREGLAHDTVDRSQNIGLAREPDRRSEVSIQQAQSGIDAIG